MSGKDSIGVPVKSTAPRGKSNEYQEDEFQHPKRALERFELEEDPHRAALEDNPDNFNVHFTTWASIMVRIPVKGFLRSSFQVDRPC